MSSPFEEFEYLVDYLPDEGEAVVVTRCDGELVCESYQRENQNDSLLDPGFYGRLVHANERLNTRVTVPIWSSLLGYFWACVAIHYFSGWGWRGWFLDVGLAFLFLPICIAWIHRRQTLLFQSQFQPMFNWQLRRTGGDRFAILGAMRQHPELSTITDQLARSID